MITKLSLKAGDPGFRGFVSYDVVKYEAGGQEYKMVEFTFKSRPETGKELQLDESTFITFD